MTTTKTLPVALTIAGSDSGGGAGIQADLKTFAAHGVYGASALTAVTAQNTRAVMGVELLSPSFVTLQIDAVVDDIGVDAVKTGMLATAELIAAVVSSVTRHAIEKLVVDPVMVAKSGDRLLASDAIDALRGKLLPLAHVVTPNLPEAAAIVGFAVEDEDDVQRAARRIVELGAHAVVIKGGHAAGELATDWLFDGSRFTAFSAPRLETRNTHGTGCTFAAAIAAGLAKGLDLHGAVDGAKRYLTAALHHGIAIGKGHGPVGHFLGRSVWPTSGEA